VGRLPAIGATLFALALAGCGGEEDLAASGPGKAQVALLENVYGGQYERAWADLYPAHREVARLPRFVRCSQQVEPTTAKLASIEVLDVFEDDVVIPAIGDEEVKAVRLRVASLEGDSDTFVNHAVKVGDRWLWVLNATSYRAYQQGRCPR